MFIQKILLLLIFMNVNVNVNINNVRYSSYVAYARGRKRASSSKQIARNKKIFGMSAGLFVVDLDS